jgi:hypothetical protein
MTSPRHLRAALAAAAIAAVAAPSTASADDVVLRRDGSKAVPIVTVPEPARAEGFDWGDAGIGAGVGLAALLLGAAGARVAQRTGSDAP